MVAPKGATLEDFKKLAGGIVDTAVAAKAAVTVASATDAALNLGNKLAEGNTKAVEALQGAQESISAKQKKYHDAAQNPDNSVADRILNSFREAGAAVENKAVGATKNTLKNAANLGSTVTITELGDLYRRHFVGTADEDKDKDKKKEEGEVTSRSLLNSAVKPEDEEKLSASGAPNPNPGLEPPEDEDELDTSVTPAFIRH